MNNDLYNDTQILIIEAPKTFLIEDSLILLLVAKASRPNNPMLAINNSRPAEIEKTTKNDPLPYTARCNYLLRRSNLWGCQETYVPM